jgi:outer membrane protein OmpA-like peptidoglycan-associated protein
LLWWGSVSLDRTQELSIMPRRFITTSALVLALGCSHQQAAETTTARDEHGAPSAGDDETTPCGDAQVFFAAGESELDAGAREHLDLYAGCLARHEIDTVYIAGMTDPEGTVDENLVLGRNRALAVADYLHASGCEVDFVIRSYGEQGALRSEPLWPLERSAEVTAISTTP